MSRMCRCLYCYKELEEGQVDFHPKCARKIFRTNQAPLLQYTRDQMTELAEQVIHFQTTLTGVQPKLSLDVSSIFENGCKKLTIIRPGGRYILKPQTEQFKSLPELEDLVMHLAELAHIHVVPHSLIRFENKELAYITRRIDRTSEGKKVPMEDMCQLTERLTEHKYRGSYEQIAKAIVKYSCAPKIDLVDFYRQVVFSWIVGNADMHLKNYSLIRQDEGYRLSPAYDLVSTAIVMPSDEEELALTLNGRKKKLDKEDFNTAMVAAGITEASIRYIYQRFHRTLSLWEDQISESFLAADQKQNLINLIRSRLAKLK